MKIQSSSRIPVALLILGLAAMLHTKAQALPLQFMPGQLAVLQEGDGGTNRGPYAPSDLNGSRQNQIFIDQFNPNGTNQTNATYQVAIPTNGPGAMLINGNAGTEGNLTLSGDKSALAFTAYQGDILSIATGLPTAPSNLNYDRGIGTVDAFGSYVNIYRGGAWYGVATGKTNPRGVATDGAGQFWGCGNGYGSMYYNAGTGFDPIQFQNIALTSCAKVVNNALYATVKGSESVNLYPAGVYSFVNFFNAPAPYPNSASFLRLVIPATSPYTNCIGFDIDPTGTTAYVSDASFGIQKYVKSGLSWALAYNLAIPGYNGKNSGIMTNGVISNPEVTNVLVGSFSLTVDWSGANPVIYATTADGAGGNLVYYGNRVIRINDTNTITGGKVIIATTNILTTVVHPPVVNGLQLTNIVYKSVTFTPDLRPVITNNPANWSAVVGDNVSFNVGAYSKYSLGYQWLSNGTVMPGQTSAPLNLASVGLVDDGSPFQCVVSNIYGAVTSSVAILSVSAVAIPPTVVTGPNLTNFVGNNQSITVAVTGTDPKSGYKWYFNGAPLSDINQYSGTSTRTLTVTNLQPADAGVYSAVATNRAGSDSNVVASLFVTYAPPVLVQPPQSMTTFVGRSFTNNSTAYGAAVTEQWWRGRAITTNVSVTTSKAVTIYTNSVLFTNINTVTTNSPAAPVISFLDASVQSGQYLTLVNLQLTDSSGTSLAKSTNNGTPSFTGITNGIFVTNTVITLATNINVSTSTNNYFVVFTNPGGSITTAPVTLTVVKAPPHTFVSYSNIGQSYTQNFDSLPIPGFSSAEGANPLHIPNAMTNLAGMLTNGNPGVTANLAVDVNYSLDTPMDFGYPILAAGSIGGLGLSNAMPGWYGWAQKALVFGAGKGDQSQGAVVDNGANYLADGSSLAGVTNRALGLIATTKSGTVAFGVALINKTTNTLTKINLSYLGELWRNNANQQVLQFGYVVDAAGTNSTFPDINILTLEPSLDVAFPPSDFTQINDGTQSTNQTNVVVNGLVITDWPPNTTLWLVWQGQTLGGAQDVAIDNLSFSAVVAPTVTTQPAGSLTAGGAVLNGTVSPNGAATAYYFQYGTNTSYGKATATNALATGAGSTSVSTLLAGLLPGTTYHFRAVAGSSEGTNYGADLTFATLPVSAPRLVSTRIVGVGGALQFIMTNAPGASFTVLASTNITLPLLQWQNLGQPAEGPSGVYQFNDLQATNYPQRFYILTQP